MKFKNENGTHFRKALWVLLLILLSSSVLAEECNMNLQTYLRFKAFDSSGEISTYQHPEYREDDFLRIWNFNIVNDANCTSTPQALALNLYAPDGEKNGFCQVYFIIPALASGDHYAYWFNGTTLHKNGNFTYISLDYTDAEGKLNNLCSIALSKVGTWKMELKIDPLNSSQRVGSYGYSIIGDNNVAYGESFKVREKQTLVQIEQQGTNLILAWATIILAGVAIIAQFYIPWRDENRKKKNHREHQIALIKSISTRISLIKKAISGQKEELGKGVIPSYHIPSIGSSFYVEKIDLSIDGKNTEKLRELLLTVDDKIDTIRNIITLAQEAVVQKQISSKENLRAELTICEFKYHSSLEKMLIDVITEMSSWN